MAEAGLEGRGGADERDDFTDEGYFDRPARKARGGFDSRLLAESLHVLPLQRPLLYAEDATVTDAMRGMQRKRRHCVLVTRDGTARTALTGLFTERDVLFRIIDRGRNPASLPLRDVMEADPETLPLDATVAQVLNRMAVAGRQHLPVVDAKGRPAAVVSVDDLMSFLVETFPREVLNLPAEELYRGPQAREGA
jgi:CBS domain-containing protein